MEKEYSAKIVNSWQDMSVLEKIQSKNLAAAQKLNDLVPDKDGLLLDIVNLVTLDIHNEEAGKKADGNTDYTVFVIIDENGEKYHTSSQPLARTLNEIREEFLDSGEEFPCPCTFKIFKQASQNNSGKILLADIVA